MKKILLILCFMFLTVGCTNINKSDYKTIIGDTIKDNYNNKCYNQYHNGYKYYLPKYMNIKNDKDYNEKINSGDYTYYLYVDIIRYYNKSKISYKNIGSYIDYEFSNKNLDGYLKVLENNGKYLVEIIYNYAKIEVIVDEIDINNAINNAIIILSTIKYDDDVIRNIVEDDKINSKEEVLNIFDKKTESDDFINIIEEYDTYEEEKSDIPDYDVINN